MIIVTKFQPGDAALATTDNEVVQVIVARVSIFIGTGGAPGSTEIHYALAVEGSLPDGKHFIYRPERCVYRNSDDLINSL